MNNVTKISSFYLFLQNEIEEEEAIRKILEEGRQTIKCQGMKEIDKKNRRKYYSTSDDSDSSSHHTNRRYRRSRSRDDSLCRSRSRKKRSRSRDREDGELESTDLDSDDLRKYMEFGKKIQKKRKKKNKGNEYEGILYWFILIEITVWLFI